MDEGGDCQPSSCVWGVAWSGGLKSEMEGGNWTQLGLEWPAED